MGDATLGEVIAMMHYLNWNDSYNAWWWIIPLVVYVLAVFGIIVVYAKRIDESMRSSTSRAEQVLMRRFASGEIDVDECNERLHVLRDRRRHRVPQPN